MESLAKEYVGRLEVVIYRAGKDFGYLKKYGGTTKSFLVINENKAVRSINKNTISAAFEEALRC